MSMANGFVEIHDPLSNHSNVNTGTNCNPESTSDTDNMDDTLELRILMAYSKRRWPKRDIDSTTQDSPTTLNGDALVKGPSTPQMPAKTEKEEKRRKKKRGFKRLPSIFRCIKPQTEREQEQEPAQTIVKVPDDHYRCAVFKDDIPDEVKNEDEFEEIADQLTQIADEIPFTPPPPPELEADSPPEDDVEKVIALLLREAGDQLNKNELMNASIATELFWNYSFFKKLITTLLIRMGLMTSEPNALGPQASPKTQIAVTCEVASRLLAVDTLPMSRMLHHGARYLQEHYSSWAQQQGGYERAFHSEDEDEVQ